MAATLHQEKVSAIPLPFRQRPHLSGLKVTWTNGSDLQQTSPLVTPWLLQESPALKIALILFLSLREVERYGVKGFNL